MNPLLVIAASVLGIIYLGFIADMTYAYLSDKKIQKSLDNRR